MHEASPKKDASIALNDECDSVNGDFCTVKVPAEQFRDRCPVNQVMMCHADN